MDNKETTGGFEDPFAAHRKLQQRPLMVLTMTAR